MNLLDEVEPLSASRDSIPWLLWGWVGRLSDMVGPVSSIGMLPNELNADGTLDVVSDVKQLAANNPDVVLLETGLWLGWGRLWSPLDGQFLWLPLNLLLRRRG